jgi:hypothetical protein
MLASDRFNFDPTNIKMTRLYETSFVHGLTQDLDYALRALRSRCNVHFEEGSFVAFIERNAPLILDRFNFDPTNIKMSPGHFYIGWCPGRDSNPHDVTR